MKLLIGLRGLFFIMVFTGVKYSYSQQAIIWNSLQLPVQVSKKWQVPFDFSYRTIGFSAAAYQYTFRTGIRRIFNPVWQAAAGGALFVTRTSFLKEDHHFVEERRLWQEVLAEHPVGNDFSVQNRFRIEERFFEATSSAGSFTAFRFRYRLALIKLVNNKWRLLLADEYMQQQDHNNFHFQQNRLAGSVSYFLNSTTHLQAGYIWSALPASSQHIVLLAFQKTIFLNGNRQNRK